MCSNNQIKKIYIPIFILLFLLQNTFAQNTLFEGKVMDGYNMTPIPYASVVIMSPKGNAGISSNESGEFSLRSTTPIVKVQVSSVGFESIEVELDNAVEAYHQLFLFPSNNIETISIKAPKIKYSNKNNPAVELIRQVIAHRNENRLTGQDYAEYKQYEKITLGISNLSEKFKNKKIFRNYQFLFQEDDSVKDGRSYILPAFIQERASKNYYRKDPKTTKQYILAENQANFDNQFIDNEGLSNYFNRLYDEVEIYDNNITLLTTQFLSPIANTAPTFYRFYITDTIKSEGLELVELSFFPRNKNDLLFKGKLYVTLDGNYAVKGASMTINKEINLNFVRDLHVGLVFEKDNNSKYFLHKSTVDIDFSLTEKGKGIRGRRVVMFTDYLSGISQPDSIYQTAPAEEYQLAHTPRENIDWSSLRPEPLSDNEAVIYQNIEGLQNMSSFKKVLDISALLLSGYKQAGPMEIGPVNTFYSYNPVEGLRLRVGGRTTERLSERFYAEGFTAYGTEDKRWKYFASGTYSLNKKSPYKFPQHYIRVSASHDTKIPGQTLEFIQEDNVLLSFKRGENRSYTYNDMYRIEYKAEFRGNFAITSGLSMLRQSPAGILSYQQMLPDGTLRHINNVNTTEFNVGLRYAPVEEFYQGKIYRTPIFNEFPIFTLNYTAGIKGLLQGEYNYHNISAGAFKRFYLSQLGYADINLDGTYIFGNDLPFPLLTIHRANQTYAYQLNSYNLMNFMEFVSDHHASVNIQYYMNGFLFNKIPILKQLKLREVFSFKGIYGGLRDSNNPDINPNVYRWQRNGDGDVSSFTFYGNKPYMEASVGIANIFKILRVDAVKRLNYLEHPNAPSWGVRARIKIEF